MTLGRYITDCARDKGLGDVLSNPGRGGTPWLVFEQPIFPYSVTNPIKDAKVTDAVVPCPPERGPDERYNDYRAASAWAQ